MMLMRLQHASLVIRAVLLFSLVGASCVCAETHLQYQDRGNRHEGIKGKPVSGSDVELISARVNYTDEVQQVPLRLKVKFYLVQPSEVYLTVRELVNTYYYWMDNVRPAKPWQSGFGNVFAWPTRDVIQTLDQLKMNPYGLGIVARLGGPEPRKEERVAPVIFYHARFPAVVKGYLFTLRTSDYARLICSVYKDGATEPVYTQIIRRQRGDRPFTVRWDSTQAHEGPYTLVVTGYFLDTNDAIKHVVHFYHQPHVR